MRFHLRLVDIFPIFIDKRQNIVKSIGFAQINETIVDLNDEHFIETFDVNKSMRRRKIKFISVDFFQIFLWKICFLNVKSKSR